MRSEVVPQAGGFCAWHPRQGADRWRASAAALTVGVVIAACGGAGRQQITIGPPPAKETRAVLAGPLCQDNQCRCRGDDGGDAGVGVPDGKDRKRYELRLSSAYDLWVTIDHAPVLYKTPERAAACFYVDLPTG